MDPLNNATLTSYMFGLSQSGWLAFANDLRTNFVNAWATRFILTPRDSSALALIPTVMHGQIADGADWGAQAVGSSRPLDASGQFFDSNPAAPSTAIAFVDVEVKVSANVDSTGNVSYDVSISIKF